MSDGIATTFATLAQSANDAAADVLTASLGASHAALRDGALEALLQRRTSAGLKELVRLLPRLEPRSMEILRRHPSRLCGALREALLGSDETMFCNACHAAVRFVEHDLTPTLVNVMEERTGLAADLAAAAMRGLVEQLAEQLGSPRDAAARRDPRAALRYVIEALEESLARYGKHRRREAVEALLLVAPHDNATLVATLQNPHHAAFLPLVETLRISEHPAIVGLLMQYLEDPRAPSAVLTTIGNRGDAKFVRRLLHRVANDPARIVLNLRRMESFAWLANGPSYLRELDETAQVGVMRLVTHAAVPRGQAFLAVATLLGQGYRAARREAALALDGFSGADANALALQALEDIDEHVQANVIGQLRRRGIPGILPRLVGLVDSRHATVRSAARAALAEFTFTRFVGAYDMLSDEVRRSTAALVRKVDPQALMHLKQELQAPGRVRRLRGLEVARLMDFVELVEPQVIALLADDDHLVRVQAVSALARLATPAARRALAEAMSDSSAAVQAALREGVRHGAEIDQDRA